MLFRLTKQRGTDEFELMLTTLRVGDLVVTEAEARESRSGKVLRLRPAQLRILYLLASRCGQVVSREDLIRAAVRRPTSEVERGRGLDVHIHGLRRRLRGTGCDVRTVQGEGYRIEAGIAPKPRGGAAKLATRTPAAAERQPLHDAIPPAPRSLAQVLGGAALAFESPVRTSILEVLAEGPISSVRLAERLHELPKTVTRHLNVLRMARLVEIGRRGRYAEYRLSKDAIQEVSRALESLAALLMTGCGRGVDGTPSFGAENQQLVDCERDA